MPQNVIAFTVGNYEWQAVRQSDGFTFHITESLSGNKFNRYDRPESMIEVEAVTAFHKQIHDLLHP
jgi:hypothetical protein